MRTWLQHTCRPSFGAQGQCAHTARSQCYSSTAGVDTSSDMVTWVGDVRKYIVTVPLMAVSPPSCNINEGRCFDLYQGWLHWWIVESIGSCMVWEIGALLEMIGWSPQCQLLHGWWTSRTSELGNEDWVTSSVIVVERDRIKWCETPSIRTTHKKVWSTR